MLEIFIKDKNNKWQILDLFNDESVEMDFKISDMIEIDKAFSTTTKSFSVPASSSNNLTFDYYFDINVNRQKIQFYDCQLFVNGQKNRVGRMAVMAGKYENNQLITYSLEFYSALLPLKELIGETTLKDLNFSDLNLNWTLSNITNIINNNSWNNSNILVPLISVNQLWNLSESPVIKMGSLRPALKLKTIIDRIQSHFNIDINFPFYNDSWFNKIFVWLNKNADENNEIPLYNLNTFTRSMSGNPANPNWGMFPVTSRTNYGIRVVEVDNPLMTPNIIRYVIKGLKNTLNDVPYDEKATILLRETTDASTGRTTIFETKLEGEANGNGDWVFNGSFANKGRTRFYEAILQTDVPASFTSFDVEVETTYSPIVGYNGKYVTYKSANNLQTGTQNIQISKSLDIPVIDFLSALVRTFNLKILESRDSIYSMDWKNRFHDEAIDITNYVDAFEHVVESQKRYKKITLKHGEEDYYRNSAFRNLMGYDYGTEVYEDDSNDVSEEFEVESGFSILSYFTQHNTNIVTSYGFDSDYKQVDPEQLTLIMANDLQNINVNNATGVAVQLKLDSNTVTTNLNNYTPFQNADGFDSWGALMSLTFNQEILPFDSEVVPSNLYKMFYKSEFQQLYSNNTYMYDFTAYLPAPVVNEFTMENTLIIRDVKYKPYEISIDLATGKSDLKLQRYNNIANDLIVNPNQLFFVMESTTTSLRVGFNGSSSPDGIIGHRIEYKKSNEQWTSAQSVTVPAMANNQVSYTYLIDGLSPNTTYNLRIQALSTSGGVSTWVNTDGTTQAETIIYPPTFYPYFDAEYSGRIQYNINLGMQNTVQPTHYRIEWIRTSNGLSQSTTIVAVQNQSMLGQINSGTGTFNVRAQCGVNGTFGQWTSLTQVIVS